MAVDNRELIEKVELLKSLRVVKKDAEISESTGFPRSAVSSYLSGRIKASKNFLDKFNEVYYSYFDNKIINPPTNILNEPSISYAPAGKFPKKIGMGSRPVPYYDVDFAAGAMPA
jgi:predicted DNA-binding transcriptional regulator AlpA